MLRLTTLIVLYCTVSQGQAFPFAAPPFIPPVVAPIAPLVPTAYPFTPTSRPVVPGLPGYNNPLVPAAPGYNNAYYNQYNRLPAIAVPILTYTNEHAGDGTYSFSFTTADGKQAQEAGYLKDAYIDNTGEPHGTQVVQGSYAYISPEGTPIQVTYIADENGFRPSGVHIPADGKAVIPLIGDKERQILHPFYNEYDHFNYPNRFRGVGNINRPYDPRYSNEASKYNNPYFNNPYSASGLKNPKGTTKKIA